MFFHSPFPLRFVHGEGASGSRPEVSPPFTASLPISAPWGEYAGGGKSFGRSTASSVRRARGSSSRSAHEASPLPEKARAPGTPRAVSRARPEPDQRYGSSSRASRMILTSRIPPATTGISDCVTGRSPRRPTASTKLPGFKLPATNAP